MTLGIPNGMDIYSQIVFKGIERTPYRNLQAYQEIFDAHPGLMNEDGK